MTIYCLDIDGTICTNTNGEYEKAKPYNDVKNKINSLYEDGKNKIIFMTARGSVSGIDYGEFTRNQIKNWGFKFHELIMNKKPHADIFIDDKAINIKEWRSRIKKKKIGFVASSFDLIHPGYIIMLKDAKTVCDYLICGLHDDPSIERENKNKPVQTLDERKMVLEAIKYVDKVISYKYEKDLVNLIKTIKPDVRILGTDYKNKDNITGIDLGIEIHWHNRNHSWSTSELRGKIKNAQK